MDRFAKSGMDRGMDHGVWIVCGPGTLIHALYFYPHPYGSGSIFKPQNKALGCLGWLKYNEGLSHKFIAYDSLNHMDLG